MADPSDPPARAGVPDAGDGRDDRDGPGGADPLARAARGLAGELEPVLLPADASVVRRRGERRRARRRTALTAGCAAAAVVLAGGSWQLLGDAAEPSAPPAARTDEPPPADGAEPTPDTVELPPAPPPQALPGPDGTPWRVLDAEDGAWLLREFSAGHKIDCDLPWEDRDWYTGSVTEPLASRETHYLDERNLVMARFQVMAFADEEEASARRALEWEGAWRCGMERAPQLTRSAEAAPTRARIDLSAWHGTADGSLSSLRQQYVVQRGSLLAVLVVVAENDADDYVPPLPGGDGAGEVGGAGDEEEPGAGDSGGRPDSAGYEVFPEMFEATSICLVARLDPDGPLTCMGEGPGD